MTQYIYQSPQFGKRLSAPIDASDSKAHAVLEGAGWRIVETLNATLDGDITTVPVVEEETFEDVDGLTEVQRDALIEAGYIDAAALTNATDEELRAVKGIGPATVKAIRKALDIA